MRDLKGVDNFVNVGVNKDKIYNQKVFVIRVKFFKNAQCNQFLKERKIIVGGDKRIVFTRFFLNTSQY